LLNEVAKRQKSKDRLYYLYPSILEVP
jgi:hypothetical protein